MLADRLVVGLLDGNGKLSVSQPYFDYVYGSRSKDIIIPVRGRRLLAILQEDIGNISFEDNRLVLKQILRQDITVSAMNLLGKIAEAVIVRRCYENSELNKRLFQLATKKRAHLKTVERFVAIGTGLKQTQIGHPRRYNPSDPQRDIMWVDENDIPAMMKGSNSQRGIEAGLQIKTSIDGLRYVYSVLSRYRYEVPLVYFPINLDFERVVEKLLRDPNIRILDPLTGEYRGLRIGEDLVDIRSYDQNAFEEVKDYHPLILSLYRGEIELEDLVDEASGAKTLENTVFEAVHKKDIGKGYINSARGTRSLLIGTHWGFVLLLILCPGFPIVDCIQGNVILHGCCGNTMTRNIIQNFSVNIRWILISHSLSLLIAYGPTGLRECLSMFVSGFRHILASFSRLVWQSGKTYAVFACLIPS